MHYHVVRSDAYSPDPAAGLASDEDLVAAATRDCERKLADALKDLVDLGATTPEAAQVVAGTPRYEHAPGEAPRVVVQGHVAYP